MNKNNSKSALTTLSMAMLLVACNGNDHDAPASTTTVPTNTTTTLKTLTITPSLGKILKAKVVLKNAANNAPIGEDNTGTAGKVTFTIPSTVSTVIAEVQGGNGAQYFDEATGKMVDLPAGSVLRAATTVVANNSEIGVTALTEAAVKRAEALAGTGNIIPQLNTAKAQIESAFGVADILKAPTLVGSQQELAALGSSAAEQYALRLATLAKVAQQQLGSSEAAPALKIAQAIAKDLADGNIDGSGNTGALPYDVATFASQYQAQALKLVQDFIATASQNGFDAAKLQALLTFVQNNPLNLTVTPPAIVFALTGFTPITAEVGVEVTITGTGFVANPTKMKVTFANNVMATIVSATAGSLVVTVPQGAVTGKMTVTNLISNESKTSVADFVLAATGGGGGSDCGQMPTLTFDDLLPFAGSYAVEIKNGSLNPTTPPSLVKAATLQLTAVNPTAKSALVKLNGATANVLSVCQNGDNILVNLDKNNAHVDFNLLNNQKTANGIDFSNAGEYFDPKQTNTGGGGGCTGTVTPTVNTNKDMISLSWPTVTGATSYRVNRKLAKAGNSDIPLTQFIGNQTTATFDDTNNIFAGGVYSYEVTANGVSCTFPVVDVIVGTAIPQGGTWLTRLVGTSGQTLFAVASKGDLVVTGGQGDGSVATQKSTDNGSTWTGLSVGTGTKIVNGVASNSQVMIAGGDGVFVKTTDGSSWSNIDLPRPADMRTDGLFYVASVKYVNNQFVVAGGYNNGLSSPFPRNVFIATSPDGVTWQVKTPTLDGFNNGMDITGQNSELIVLYKNQSVQKILKSTDNGLTWTIQAPDFGANFNRLSSITVGADGKYYGFGDFPAISKSTDGIVWIETASFDKSFVDSSCSSGLRGITRIDNRLVGICATNGTSNQSKLIMSEDGRGWFVYGGLIDGIGQAVIKNNGRYIVVGNKAEKIGTSTFSRQFVSVMD